MPTDRRSSATSTAKSLLGSNAIETREPGFGHFEINRTVSRLTMASLGRQSIGALPSMHCGEGTEGMRSLSVHATSVVRRSPGLTLGRSVMRPDAPVDTQADSTGDV